MKVVRYGKDELERVPEASLTLGTYDGVHLGHRDLLCELLKGEQPTVVTFEPHPQHVLRSHPERLEILTPTPEKLRKLERIGVARAVILPFTQALAQLPAEQFLSGLLLGEIGLSRLVVGFNHSFGHNREGNIDFMRRRSDPLGFELVVVDAHTTGEAPVSSTMIRRALNHGELRLANECLTMPFRMEAKVVHGEGRGHELGYPTANLRPLYADQLIPAEGVYAVRATVDGREHEGVASIGRKETFGDHPLAIEVHLFDVELNLYGQQMSVDWIDYLRGQEMFASADELVQQMHRDRDAAREALAEAGPSGLLPVDKQNQNNS